MTIATNNSMLRTGTCLWFRRILDLYFWRGRVSSAELQVPVADVGRYMRVTRLLVALLLLGVTSCSTQRAVRGSNPEGMGHDRQVGPTGTFIGPTVRNPDLMADFSGAHGSAPVVKVRLETDGTYVADDIGPPEFWMMMEGKEVYPQRIKFPAQKGHWTWDRETGELTFTPETQAAFRWGIAHLRFEKNNPSRLGWGQNAFLERQEQ
jgi:hypothetical protein